MVKKRLKQLFVYLALFIMYLPIFVLIIFSFTVSDQVGTWNGFSTELYQKLVENKELMTAVGNTLLIAFVSAIVSTLLGTLGAIGTFYSSKKVKKAVEGITQLPVVNGIIFSCIIRSFRN